MARINLEVEDLLKDHRFTDLILKLGSRRAAYGAVIEAFVVAQKFWKNGQRPIPSEVYERERLSSELVEVGLATRTDDGLYIAGSKEQFAWLIQRSTAGKKGGPAAAKMRLENKEKSKQRKSTNNDGNDGSRPLTLSPSLSPSQEPRIPSESSGAPSGAGRPLATGAPVSDPQEFIAAYCEAYRARYGGKARPDLRGKVQGQVKTLLGEIPLERAKALIATYLGMSDPWFLTKAHDFGTFIENLSKVGLALDTGKVTTRTEAQAADRSSALASQLQRISEGKA